jgi:hypothetical protein
MLFWIVTEMTNAIQEAQVGVVHRTLTACQYAEYPRQPSPNSKMEGSV